MGTPIVASLSQSKVTPGSLLPMDCLEKKFKTGEALLLAALAPNIISLLQTIIEKVPEALGSI